ncbi:hypothetical protein ACFE04_013919 [Oxalis oulophora]
MDSSIPQLRPKVESPLTPQQQQQQPPAIMEELVHEFSQRLISLEKNSSLEIETLKEEIFTLKIERRHWENSKKRIDFELNKLASENKDLREQNRFLVAEQSLKSRKVSNLEERENVLWEKLKKSQEQCAELEFKKEKISELEVKKLTSEVEALKVQNNLLVGEKLLTSEQVTSFEEMEHVLWTKLKKSQEQCAELEFERERMESKVNLWKEDLNGRVSRLEAIASSLTKCQGHDLDDLSDLPTADIKPPVRSIEIVDISDEDSPTSRKGMASGRPAEVKFEDGTPLRKRKFSSSDQLIVP